MTEIALGILIGSVIAASIILILIERKYKK